MHGVDSRGWTFQLIPLRILFARRRRLRRCPDSVCNTLSGHWHGRVQVQPSALPIYPLVWKSRKPAVFTPAVPAAQRQRQRRQQRQWQCSGSAVAVLHRKYTGYARKAAPRHAYRRPLSSESTVPTLLRLRRRLTPAKSVPVCLQCLTSRVSAGQFMLVIRLLTSKSTAFKLTLRRIDDHCHFSSLQLTGRVFQDSKSPTLNIAIQIHYSNLPKAEPVESRQLNRPTR